MIRLAVVVSGRGSNLQAIIDSIEAGELPAEVGVVISDRPGVQALKRAERHGIKTVVVNHSDYASEDSFNKALEQELAKAAPDLVVLAGFMRIVGKELVQKYRWRMINIHPALLPAFPGLEAQRQAVEYGVRVSGCTVHFVDEGMDTGPIILQKEVPVYQDDDADTLAGRILAEEHRLLPEAVRLFAEGRLKVEGRRVRITACEDAKGVMEGCK